ncbi:MAG: LLM class flavin-dependent oxidoreductase [Actinomycetota bacterium]|nr:LLM class flavin-dependent oxidoreductase [Actinomycetota bacterium]
MARPIEAFLFLPQMRMPVEAIVERAVAAEESGFAGIAFMDHLAPPLADEQPMYEALTLTAWVAARTERLTVSNLVLCDAFRHPAVLARQAVTLDHASGGRFELGIGWGSVPEELSQFGVTAAGPAERVERLAETLEVMKRLWTGEPVSYEGRHFRLAGAVQRPVPLDSIPVVIGGAGPRTLDLVRRHADWWNLPVHLIGRLDELRDRVGTARPSIQQAICYVADEAHRETIEETARRRFGMMGPMLIGDDATLRAGLADLQARGVERIYLWFTDFAEPSTLRAFGDRVLSAR